jgi:osmotically-inducible protein OsmY
MSQDSELQRSVLAELQWDPSVTATDIGVTARAGVVTLTGHVESFAGKHAAEAAVWRVRGVRAVAQDIDVRLAFDRLRGDDEIAAAALERLAWDVSVPTGSIHVRVEAGWLTMTGEVDWFYQKHVAEQDLRRLAGVVGLTDQVVVRTRVEEPELADRITQALHRSWFFDGNTVRVTAVGGDIRLTGTVRSPHERQVAAETAWAAPGTTSVDNAIAIL